MMKIIMRYFSLIVFYVFWNLTCWKFTPDLSHERATCYTWRITYLCPKSWIKANSVDSEQMSQNVVSDQGLHLLAFNNRNNKNKKDQ